jgi:Tfp pilus assembly protein PilE
MKKLQSFTILELAVTLLISSVVIGIVYYAYLLFNSQFTGYRQKSALVNEYHIFRKAFQIDMERAHVIQRLPAGQFVFVGTDSAGATQYQFNNDVIVRESANGTDTFTIKNNGYDLVAINDSSMLVEKIVIHLSMNDIPLNAVFYKQYSAAQLIVPQYFYERTP